MTHVDIVAVAIVVLFVFFACGVDFGRYCVFRDIEEDGYSTRRDERISGHVAKKEFPAPPKEDNAS